LLLHASAIFFSSSVPVTLTLTDRATRTQQVSAGHQVGLCGHSAAGERRRCEAHIASFALLLAKSSMFAMLPRTAAVPVAAGSGGAARRMQRGAL
jgi:hypothetical protein